MNYLLHVGLMLTNYKNDHHPIPTPENKKLPGNFQNKPVSSTFSQLESSKENVLWEYDAVTLKMLYLNVLHDMVSQNS